MEAELRKQIEQAISDNLPATVGDVLRKRLEQADRDAKMLKDQTEIIRLLEGQNKDLTAKVSAFGSLDRKAADLSKREADVTMREIRADLVVQKAEAAEQRVADAKEIVALVFQNNRFKYSQFESRQVIQPNGGWLNTQSLSDTKTVEGET